MVRTTWATSVSSLWSPHLPTARALPSKGSIQCYTAPGLAKAFLSQEQGESSMAVIWLNPLNFGGQLWPRKGQWLARVPNSQQLSARPQGPPDCC